MQLTRLIRLSLIVAALVMAYPMKATPPKSVPTAVEVWSGGDDALTMRLRDALENAFKSSREFRLSSGKKPGTLVVTIPSNVHWKDVGKRTRVLYTVQFTSAENQDLGSSKGSCWDDKLTICANQIVKDAKTAAWKAHRKRALKMKSEFQTRPLSFSRRGVRQIRTFSYDAVTQGYDSR